MRINQEIARIFFEMADLLQKKKIPFKPRAYEKAATSVATLNQDLTMIYRTGGMEALRKIPAVGETISRQIAEYIESGQIKLYERLKEDSPSKSRRRTSLRKHRLGSILFEIEKFTEVLRKLAGVSDVAIAGSLRRMEEVIEEVEIIIVSAEPASVADQLKRLAWIEQCEQQLDTIRARLRKGVPANLRIVSPDCYGAALCFHTGSNDHSAALSRIAQARGYELNELGVFANSQKIAGQTENEIYQALGLPFIEPELRENHGEIEAAFNNALPDLVGYGDLKGDLQVQTNWTDGRHSIEKMAREAERIGLEYIAITDHTQALQITGGLDESRLMEQARMIDELNQDLHANGKKFRILKGAELNILKDGTLDIEDAVLKKLDVVGAAIHHHFRLTKQEQTERVIRAMENPHVDIIFHLSGRMLLRRDPIELDFDQILDAALRTGTVLEIDGTPDRLDIKEDYIRRCVASCVKMCIDSDAHSVGEYRNLQYGIAQARRGWAEKKHIINTLPVEEFLQELKAH